MIDDKGCKVVGINILRKGGVDVYVWKLRVAGVVSYQVNCPLYDTSGFIPVNEVYERIPPPAWVKRKLATDQPINANGSMASPLCCSCKLNLSWNVSGMVTVVPGTIPDPTPPPPPPKR